MKIEKLNESFSQITGTESELQYIANRLKVEEPGAFFNPLVKRGFKSPFIYFTKKFNNSLIVYNGHLRLIGHPEVLKSDFTLNEIKEYLQSVIPILPFKPYDYQLRCFIESILNVKHINLLCTGCLDPETEIEVEVEGCSEILTYREIHKLIDKGIKLKVKTPDGYEYITDKFVKKDSGYKITYNDKTSTICAQTHNMQFNGKLKSAVEIQIGDVDDYSGKIVVSKEKIPEQEFYDFEISNQNGLYIQNGIIHHNSGKSMVIALLLDFFLKHNKRCLLLVPNINLLEQFKSDIQSYNLKDLYDNLDTLGGGTKTDFKSKVLISTWQSMILYKSELNKTIKFDVLINDEVHKNAGEVSSEIATSLLDTKYRFGFTGTLPEDPVLLYRLIGLFGEDTKYISSRELIERGLGTPIFINTIIIDYDNDFKDQISFSTNWLEKLKYIKENENRNNFITDLSISLLNKHENSLVLFSHTQFGKMIFTKIMGKLYPEITIENKNITGKYSFEFQKKYHVYFINGEDDGKIREQTRKILEIDKGAILISNYAILSTGVNIKNLHNMIFATPLKSYTTITQSIGRGIRKHSSKDKFTVFDLVDNLGKRKYSGTFYKQYKHRLSTSYYPEGYQVHESVLKC